MKGSSNLLSPINVGGHSYRNRIEAAQTSFVSASLRPQSTDRMLRMLEDRAKGGCTNVVSREITVNFNDSLRPVGDVGKTPRYRVDYNNLTSGAFEVLYLGSGQINILKK